MILFGITGTDGAGKGTVVDYLVKEKGCRHYYNRDVWEKVFVERGMESTRANMRLVANEMRAAHGDDFLVTHFLKVMDAERPTHAVIDSIRTLAEAKTLKAEGGILLAVDADQHLRYDRITARQSSSDQVTFEEFVAQEELEMNDPDPHGMQKAAVIAAADYIILNNGTVEELNAAADAFLEKYGYGS